MLTDQAKQAIREQMARYPVSRSALGPALYIAQQECGGWVPPEAVRDVAEVMGLEPADVQSTMSFYVMYNKAPVGKYMIEICHNISCAVLGCSRLFEVVEQKCGIRQGETSEDGMFTLKGVECLAACEGAPVLQLNGLYHENVTPEQLETLIDRLRAEAGIPESIYNAVYTPERTPRSGNGAANGSG
ncbi:MAG TPA: NAD(P)H-dependent oxidoreductase subunit E [Armatimonadota bacterium]|nr:NAD(P)H-dependent oxidoreductase subunit E [Armatimonadota bacterium]